MHLRVAVKESRKLTMLTRVQRQWWGYSVPSCSYMFQGTSTWRCPSLHLTLYHSIHTQSVHIFHNLLYSMPCQWSGKQSSWVTEGWVTRKKVLDVFGIDAGFFFFSLAFLQISTEPLIAWSCESGATYTDSMRNVYSKESRGTCQTRGGWDLRDGERGQAVLNAWSRNGRQHYLEKSSQQRGQAGGCSRESLGGTQTARVEDASGKVRIHMWRRIVHYPGD